mgnify:FL=1
MRVVLQCGFYQTGNKHICLYEVIPLIFDFLDLNNLASLPKNQIVSAASILKSHTRNMWCNNRRTIGPNNSQILIPLFSWWSSNFLNIFRFLWMHSWTKDKNCNKANFVKVLYCYHDYFLALFTLSTWATNWIIANFCSDAPRHASRPLCHTSIIISIPAIKSINHKSEADV